MTNFLFQTQINAKRIIFRNLRFLGFSVLMPIGFYLLFTKVMTTGMSATVLTTWHVDYLLSMSVYSALISSIFTVSSTLLEDHQHHFDLLITLSPISKVQYYSAMGVVFLFLNLFSTSALEIVAILANHIALNSWQLLGIALLTPILSLPILLLGIVLSLVGSGNVISLLSNLIVFPMAILTGLWWPLAMLPNWMKTIGKQLPTYQMVIILRRLIRQQHFQWWPVLNLLV